jgi:AraC-like DNA-binding protein
MQDLAAFMDGAGRTNGELPRLAPGLPLDHAYGTAIHAHRHDWGQLLFATEGVMRVVTDVGVWMLPPRRALLIAPGVTHELTMLSKVRIRSVYVEPGALPISAGCRVIEVSGLLRELILALANDTRALPLSTRGTQLAAAETVPIAIPWPRDRRLVAVCSAIMAAPGARRSIDDWAADAGASGRTLIRLFRKETGLFYRQWLQQVHLADAFCRLARGDGVASIAAALGYRSPSAFTAMFRRVLGKTPQQYLGEWRSE